MKLQTDPEAVEKLAKERLMKKSKKRRRFMRFSGRIYKDGKFWLAEIPILDLMTQGRTKREAYVMGYQRECNPLFTGGLRCLIILRTSLKTDLETAQ